MLCLSSADSPEDDQLALPLHHGRFSFQHMTAQEAVAAQMSAAAPTQVAMRQGPSEFRPFDSSNRLLLLPSLCETLHDAATRPWPEETRALSFTVICNFLPLAQVSCSGGCLPVPLRPVLRTWGRWPQVPGTAKQLRQPLSLHFPEHAADGRSPHHPGRCLHQQHAPLPVLVTDAAGCLGDCL
jgi:hypothetical protein